MNSPPENDLCSICHSHFTAPCQANCSHWFCGNCIMLVWRHGSTLQPCKCPLCRRHISLLVPSEDTIRDRNDATVKEVLGNLETYNRLFGGRSSSLVQRMQDLPFLLRRLLREMMDPQRTLPLVIRARVYIAVKFDDILISLFIHRLVMLWVVTVPFGVKHDAVSLYWMQMILSAVYIISPIDIIPEGVLGVVGLLDDLLIALICFLHVAALYRSVLYFRHAGS